VLPFGKRRRRAQWRSEPLAPTTRRVIEDTLFYYHWLDAAGRRELDGHTRVLLEEKRFEGAAGLDVEETMRVTIAAHAAVLLLGRDTDYYPLATSIVVYPGGFRTRTHTPLTDSAFIESEEERSGESWHHGTVILAWDEIEHEIDEDTGGNVIFHEFAHQLDDEDGIGDGVPALSGRATRARWQEVMTREYERLGRAADRGARTVMDPYGSESPAEFFACATEAFFCLPLELRQRHTELYHVLAGYYRQDPAELAPY
jgi:Mlc titration factor MtfA (ptsG expression regulator)